MMMVSPSRPQAVVLAVASKVRGRYEAVFVPMFRYSEVFWLWMVDPTAKNSPVASGPMTGVPAAPGWPWRYKWKIGDTTPRIW